MLNYAKLESGAVHFNMQDVLVSDTLRATEQLIRPQAQLKQVSLAVGHCPPTLSVPADPEKVRQILLNLLSNAVKFTDPGGRVELSCEERDDVTFVVADSGIGMRPTSCSASSNPSCRFART